MNEPTHKEKRAAVERMANRWNQAQQEAGKESNYESMKEAAIQVAERHDRQKRDNPKK